MMSSEPAAPIPVQPSSTSLKKSPRAPFVWFVLFAAVTTLAIWATSGSRAPSLTAPLISPAGAAEQKEEKAEKPSKKEAKPTSKKASEKKNDDLAAQIFQVDRPRRIQPFEAAIQFGPLQLDTPRERVFDLGRFVLLLFARLL